jgi:hypothetical protein
MQAYLVPCYVNQRYVNQRDWEEKRGIRKGYSSTSHKLSKTV